jgi:hypothetical protein
MTFIRKQTAAIAATIALGAGLAPLAGAAADEAPTTEPCAAQQQQVDRAKSTLAALTARLADKATDVREAQADLRAADTAREKRSAKADLAIAKTRKTRVALARKAQVQRVAKAQERLTDCLSAAELPAVARA